MRVTGVIAGMVVLVMAAVCPAAAADKGHVQLAFFAPYQLVHEDADVGGVRFNLLYTKNRDLKGLDLGLGYNRLDGDMEGVSCSIVNLIEGQATGWQGIGFARVNDHFHGLQSAGVTWAERDITGAQFGAFNFCRREVHGLQAGLVNKADSVRGFQVGILNMTVYLHGVQIGLWNVATGKRMMRYLPIVNASF